MIRDYRNPDADAFFAAVLEDPAKLPFRFTYGGEQYRGLPADASREISPVGGDGRQSARLTATVGGTLRITLVMTHTFTHGVTEWTLYFENVGAENSAVLEDLRTETVFRGASPVLRGILGDHVNMYRPYEVALTDNIAEFSADRGRATHVSFPYFNLEYGGGGALLAIGWAGTWSASFEPTADGVKYTASSVIGLKTYLRPGEHIRTALFVLAPYKVRNEHYATNLWRDWFVRCNLPKANASGAPLEPFSTACFCYDTGLPNSDGSISERYYTWRPSLEKMLAEGIRVDYRWFDAGWYVRPDGGSEDSDWWGTVGTWTLDPAKWPGGTFRESTDFAREHGMKTMMWFETERVTDIENLEKNFGYKKEWAIKIPTDGAIMNNIGDPECFEWTANAILKTLTENRVEMYREDNNFFPAPFWRHRDAEEGGDRRGITESRMIEAHYALWDRIIEATKSYGGCAFVDSCASGGGRNDLESMRRGVPILRSDIDRTSIALRLSMTTAFNRWIPFNGCSIREKKDAGDISGKIDRFIMRASYLPAFNDFPRYAADPDQDFEPLRAAYAEWDSVKRYLLKEFYVLTPWHGHQDDAEMTAFCYFDPEDESGVLFAFRQEFCARDTLRVMLPFAGGGRFTLTDADSGETFGVTDRLTLRFPEPRTARMIWIERESDR